MGIEQSQVPAWQDENGNDIPPLSPEELAKSVGMDVKEGTPVSFRAIKNKINEQDGKPRQDEILRHSGKEDKNKRGEAA